MLYKCTGNPIISGRPRKTEVEEEEEDNEDMEEEEAAEEEAVEEETEPEPKKRRGRPSKGGEQTPSKVTRGMGNSWFHVSLCKLIS